MRATNFSELIQLKAPEGTQEAVREAARARLGAPWVTVVS